jgi:hypothetical protein
MLPFLIHFIFESKLYIGAADLSRIDKEQRYFFRSERLFPNDIIDDGFRSIIRLSIKSSFTNFYLIWVIISAASFIEAGDILLFIILLLFQCCS